MFRFFIMFNGMVVSGISAMMWPVLAFVFFVLVQVILIAVSLILLRTLFSSAPFIVTPSRIRMKMFEFADVKPGQKVYDLGCGNGRLIFEAEQKGASAVGIEMNLWIYLLAQYNKKRLGSHGVFIRKDLHKVDLSDADIIFCYLMPWAMRQLAPKFTKELKQGCRIVSHSYQLPGWQIQDQYRDSRSKHHSVFLYVV